MIRRSVVLPQPEGPSNATNSPPAISSVTSSRARVAPKDFATRSILISAMALVLWSAVGDAPHREEIATHGEDEGDGRHDQQQAAGEPEMHRRFREHGQEIGGKGALAHGEHGGRKHLVP